MPSETQTVRQETFPKYGSATVSPTCERGQHSSDIHSEDPMDVAPSNADVAVRVPAQRVARTNGYACGWRVVADESSVAIDA